MIVEAPQWERAMKVRLKIEKRGATLFEGVYDVGEAESFGNACADAWTQIRTDRLEKATSVGALMEMRDQNVLDELQGAEITIRKAL